MEHKKLALGFLAIILIACIVCLFAFAPVVDSALGGPTRLSGAATLYGQAPDESGPPGETQARNPGSQELSLVLPDWQQVNGNGFGDPGAGEVSALATFNGYLYAGTHNPIDPEPVFDGAQIFRSPDGVAWTAVTDPGFGSAHDAAPPAILDMALFKGYLYAGTGRGDAAKIYRTVNGLNWAPVVNSGFGDPDTVNVNVLAEYNSYLYAGATNQVSGAQIWRSFSGDSNSWTQVGPESPGSAPASVTALTVFSNTLYAAIEPESDAPLQIWRSYGGDVWTTVISDGFGDSDNTLSGGMAVFGDYLYLGGGNAASGAQLWRSIDGDNWTAAITPAFGDSNNQKVEMVYLFQNQLYVSVRNSVTGIEVWRSADAALWEQVNEDGFGDVDNSGTNWSNATADFLGKLYVGTSNVVDGGELWRMAASYGVDLSPDAAKSSPAGQNVTYTLQITNTGTMTDTFDLSATGYSWTTAVSTPTISLTPGARYQFSVTVSIPNDALPNDSDMATITATSQGDPAKSDSAVLTTTCCGSPGSDHKLYLPIVLKSLHNS